MHPLIHIFKAFDEVTEVKGNKAKEIMESVIKDSECRPLLEKIFDATYNPFRLFHIHTNTPTQITVSSIISEGIYISCIELDTLFNSFNSVLIELEKLNGGDKSKKIWFEFISICPDYLQYWFTMILNKDPKWGWHQYAKYGFKIPSFDVQLCNTWDGKNLPESRLAESKLNGLRLTVVPDPIGQRYYFYSRNGIQFHNCERLDTELREQNFGFNHILDGEAYVEGPNSWNNAMSVCTSEFVHPLASKLVYFIFDSILLSEWTNKNFEEILITRKLRLKESLKFNGAFKLVEGILVQTIEEIEAAISSFEKKGYEGAVLKDIDSPYVLGYQDSWLKAKHFVSGDYVITSVNEGSRRLQNTLGSLTVNVDGVLCDVGSGFSDDQRQHLWSIQKDLVGQVAEIKYQEKTKAGSLTFPIFLRLRSDKL